MVEYKDALTCVCDSTGVCVCVCESVCMCVCVRVCVCVCCANAITARAN